MSRIASTCKRLLREEGGWTRPWVSLAVAICLGAGAAAYYTGSSPSGCVYPDCFPSASNTGVPSGTTLTTYSGSMTITTNDTVIDSKEITGTLEIRATGVVIKNSLINGGLYVDDAINYVRANNGADTIVTIMDSTIDCGDTAGTTGIQESYVLAQRVEVIYCENGLSINQQITVEDSFLHHLASKGADPHEDGIQLSGHWIGSSYTDGALNVNILHNTIYGLVEAAETQNGTSAIISNPSGDEDVLVQNNFLTGGGFTLYCPRPGSGTNYQVDGNAFSSLLGQPPIGYSDDCNDEVVSGNYDYDTGDPIDFAGDG